MSSRRSRSRNSGSSRISEDQINELVFKLHQLLPSDKRSITSNNVLQETCNYIRSLQREVDDLSKKLSDLLANTDTSQAAVIRSLLTQ